MQHINIDLLEKTFHPLRVSLGNRRPDGGIVLTLADTTDVTAYSRVIHSKEVSSSDVFCRVVEDIRRELSVRSGYLSTEIRKQLVENAGVMPYISD
ncbi:DUF3509 domain-containing protein [Pseudomonas sp. 2FG]|uniref:DUF3509 domain-containing protein n=1 Tax=Pseudomonas sp. 2FG TaxID=2502191 RepID=UPI0010F51898|nr:DUF3509 domain-containing protein [Pseudomonas sp. 2FG]